MRRPSIASHSTLERQGSAPTLERGSQKDHDCPNPLIFPYQGGVALVIGLVLLVIMSLIGLSMLAGTSLETQMAGGTRESNIALEATEAGLRDAENTINPTSITTDFPAGSTADTAPIGHVGEDATEPEDLFAAAIWDGTSSVAYSSGDYPEVADQPRYILKHMGTVNFASQGQPIAQEDEGEGVTAPFDIFRTTARGTSRDGSAITVLQSYFGTPH